MERMILTPFALAVASSLPAQDHWLINEVYTDSAYIELINVGNAPADPTGLVLWWRVEFGNPCATVEPPFKFSVPGGSPAVQPGDTFVIEAGVGGCYSCSIGIPNGLPWRQEAEHIIWINRDSVDWTQGIQDMVVFGDTNWAHHTMGLFNPGGTAWSGGPVMDSNTDGVLIYRPGTPSGIPVDTNSPADWRVAKRNERTPCGSNPDTPPNPVTIGQGYSATGTCQFPPDLNGMTAALPALALASVEAFDSSLGGSFTLSVRTGMTAPPTLTALAFGNTVPGGNPSFYPPCVGKVVDYVDLATAGVLYFASPSWNADIAADLIIVLVPDNPALVGIDVCFQAYMLDMAAGACLLRSTNGLQVTVMP